MRFAGFAFVMALVLAASAKPAHACQCGDPLNPPGGVTAWRLERAKNVVVVRIKSFRRLKTPYTSDLDPQFESIAAVEKVVKGHAPKSFRLLSTGGDNGANCGIGEEVAQTFARDRFITVELVPVKARKNMFEAVLCGFTVLGNWPDRGW